MSGLSREARKFLSEYLEKKQLLEEYAQFIKQDLSRIVEASGVEAHLVSVRIKEEDSLRRKLRNKRYVNPAIEATDVVGGRVITFYDDCVDKVAEALKREFRVVAAKSIDKRKSLSLREFGYRSVHLIAVLKHQHINANKFRKLPIRRFEIQIRSILEHSWAEIEHEIIYKSGIRYPDQMKRRFASLAGTLEVLDEQFCRLREEKIRLIDDLKLIYQNRGIPLKETLDVSRLLALLELRYPKGLGWRSAEKSGRPFKRGLDVSCLGALRAGGIKMVDGLSRLMGKSIFRRAVHNFASRSGIATEAVSHLALAILAVQINQPHALELHFPELVFDPQIEQLIITKQK